MSSLKQKAFNISTQPDKPLYVVRLEDTQQIFQEQVNADAELLRDSMKETKELKQKLQQLFTKFPDINSKDYALHNGWTNHDLKDKYGLFIADVHAWKKKFEELLKEEKEAKPYEERKMGTEVKK